MKKLIIFILFLIYLNSFSLFNFREEENLYPISTEYVKTVLKRVSKNKVEFPEGVLVLPLLDNKHKLTSIGTLISTLAMYKYTYLPNKNFQILMPHVENIIKEKEFYKEGKDLILRPKEIKEMTDTLRVNSYVSGFLIIGNNKYHIELRFDGIKGSRNIGKEGEIKEIIYLPSWIAENVCNYIGLKIPKEKMEFMKMLDFKNYEDLSKVASVENLFYKDIYCLTPSEDEKLLSTYKEVYSKNPDSIFLTIRYANVLWKMHRDEEAIRILEKSLKKYPNCERLLFCYAHILNKKAYEPCGYDKIILPLLMNLLKTDYLNNLIYSILFSIFESYHLWEGYKMLCDYWVKSDPNYFLPYEERGKFYYKFAWFNRGTGWAYTVTEKGWKEYFYNLKLAEKDFKTALLLNKEAYYSMDYLMKISMELYTGIKEEEEVNKYFYMATSLFPDCVIAYQTKFCILEPKWSGSIDKLFNYIEYLVEKNFDDTHIALLFSNFYKSKMNEKGYYYEDEEVWERIKELYERYLIKNPNAIHIPYVMAKMAYMRGDYKYAKLQFDKISSFNDNGFFENFEEFIEVKKNTILKLNKKLKEDDAYKMMIEEYKKWLKKFPNYYFNYVILGYLYYKIGDFSTAIDYILKGEKINFHIPELFYVKGLIFFQKGEKEKAKECFRDAYVREEYFIPNLFSIYRTAYFISWYNKVQ